MKRKEKIEVDRSEFKILEPNINELDREWVHQPFLYYEVSVELAGAMKEMEETKAKLDLVSAELDKKIRSNPKNYDLGEKPTETSIQKTILLRPKHLEAMQFLIDARYLVEVLSAKKWALEHRKAALENLVKLQLSNYSAAPRSPEGMEDRIDQMKKKHIRGKR